MEDEGFLFGFGVMDVILWIWSLLPFEVKSYFWMCVLTVLFVALTLACCCTVCFCSPWCCCAVWLERRRRQRSRDRKELAFVTERQNSIHPAPIMYLQQPSAPPYSLV
ncbi:unnamed protein product, partial [Mesorhabditis spiculigera]